MSYSSVWPTFVCLAVLVLIASTPAMKAADVPPSPRPQRIKSLDGLRGFLAFSVFFHHSFISYVNASTGVWRSPDPRFYRLVGPVAVDVFFIITGYLFWSKAIKEKGQINLLRLYVGRVFRIAPVYLVTIFSMLTVVAFKTGFHLNQPFRIVALQAAKWSALGLMPASDVNRYANTNLILAGVTWTLYWEWMFYFSLAFTSLVARWRFFNLCLVAGLYCLSLLYVVRYMIPDPQPMPPVCLSLFLGGMTCAALESQGLMIRLKPWLMSLLTILSMAALFVKFYSANTVFPLLLMFSFFYLVISGSTLFGLLTSRAAHRLGDISYGAYLLQGLVLSVGLSSPSVRTLFITSPLYYWGLTLLGSIVLAAFATITHVWIERPGIDLGIKVSARLEQGRRQLFARLASAKDARQESAN